MVKAEPFIQNGYAVGKSITDLVAGGHQLTPAEQALYTAVYNARTTTDILNVVEPALQMVVQLLIQTLKYQ